MSGSQRLVTTNVNLAVKQVIRYLSGAIPAAEVSMYEDRIEVPSSLTSTSKAYISVINMPDNKTRNALSKSSVQSMLSILGRLQAESDESSQIRALIVRSTVPGVFCAGANLKERQTMNNNQVASWLRVQRLLMDTVSDFPYPTIAAVDGLALGGGLELALACDIRVINQSAKVGLVETRLAIIPGAGGTQRLTRLIGAGRAKEHIFLAEPIDGDEAYRLGIANRLACGDEGSYKVAIELAKKICLRGPKALRLAKAAIDNGLQTSLDTGLDIENAYYSQLLDSKDRKEGMRAFIEKREPNYTGE